MIYTEVLERGQIFPYRLVIDPPIDVYQTLRFVGILRDLFGEGHNLPTPNSLWRTQWIDGKYTIMFRTETDRTLAHIAIS